MDQPISLTSRELEVVTLVASGYSNKEIARALSIEDNTVKTDLASIYRKLGLGGRAELIVVAICRGVVDAMAVYQSVLTRAGMRGPPAC